MADAWRVWGYSVEAGHPDGPAAMVWTFADLSGRPDPDPVFDLAAAKIRIVPERFGPKFGERIIYSTVVLGCEPEDRAEDDAHQAYARMWGRHPGLWEEVRERPFPVTFWMVGADDQAFFGVIQPGMGPDPTSEVDWEQCLGRRGVNDACVRYASSGVWRWQTIPLSLTRELIESSRAGGRTLRPAGVP